MTRARPRLAEAERLWQSLTEREREVLRLVAYGRSNRQIARLLGIGEHTVETHVGNLLDKLGVASRVEAAVWAARVGAVKTANHRSGGNPPEKNGGFPGFTNPEKVIE